jgi:hypothetical protein
VEVGSFSWVSDDLCLSFLSWLFRCGDGETDVRASGENNHWMETGVLWLCGTLFFQVGRSTVIKPKKTLFFSRAAGEEEPQADCRKMCSVG